LEQSARLLLENKLITLSGTRVPITRAGALEVVPDPKDVDQVLHTLERARILRAQEHHGDQFFELGHDWLARPIQESAERKREQEKTRRARLRAAVLWGVVATTVGISVIFSILGLYALEQGRKAIAAQQIAEDKEVGEGV